MWVKVCCLLKLFSILNKIHYLKYHLKNVLTGLLHVRHNSLFALVVEKLKIRNCISV